MSRRSTAGGLHVVLVVGTRPEAIKLAPVALALQAEGGLTSAIWCTGQHARWAPEMLAYFGLRPQRLLDRTDGSGGLAELGGSLLISLQAALAEEQPDVVVVQGDTSSAFAGALAAAYAGIPVVHVEAGLRSDNRRTPFPEEAHRRAIAHFTDLHCAPTERAYRLLIKEGIDERDLILCGNTVIDALNQIRQALPANDVIPGGIGPDRKLVLLTCHRRESWGAPFSAICTAVRRIVRRGDCDIVFVLHPNPLLSDTAAAILGGVEHVHLVPPLGYPDFVQLLGRAALVLTDSGGVQEEASALGTPLLVLRDTTERPEAMQAGSARLVGSGEEEIVATACALLDDHAGLAAMRVPCSLYGDGTAGQRIARVVIERWWRPAMPEAGYISAAAASLASSVPSSA